VNIITLANIKRLVAVAFTVVTGTIAFQANTPAHAIDENDTNHHVAPAKTDDSLTDTAKKNNIRLTKTVKESGSTLEKKREIKIVPGTNKYHEAANILKAEADAKAKAEAEAKAKAKEEAEAKAKAAAAAKAKAAAAAKASSTTSSSSAASSSRSTSTSSSSRVYSGIKITFYDPAAMGSSMGYSGVAANLSVFPRGTRLKITMSNGMVIYRTVNDTGSFAASNSHQIDVAMPNNQIPSAGVLSATVTVL
jgi:3D (Asp-Asp-Asp) domain-containing protein